MANIVYNGPHYGFCNQQEERAVCWQAACEFVGDNPAPALVGFADRMEECFSSALLDKAERRFFGHVLTTGTWPKRQRFWRFISLKSRGIIPRDLREPGEKSPRRRRK